MRPRNNILAFIAAVVVSAQSFPLNIRRGSVIYDPDSIPQNERILRLFLHLASHTANRLIHLKNEAKLQKPSNRNAQPILPPFCRGIHDNRLPQAFRGRGYDERYGRYGPIYHYGQTPLRYHFTNEKLQVPLNVPPKLNRTYPESIVKEVRQNEELGKLKNHLNPRYYPNSIPNISGYNDQRDVNKTKVNNTELNDSIVVEQVTVQSNNSNDSSTNSQDKLANLPEGNGTEDSDDVPIEIASRALFNLEKNHYVTNYHDNSKNINNADTRINNIVAPNAQTMSIPQSVVINQNSGFQRNKQGNTFVEANTGINNSDSGSSGSIVVTHNAGSIVSSQKFQHSAASTKKIEKSLESFQTTKSVRSNSQLGSSGLGNTVQSGASVTNNVGNLGMARRAMDSTSNLHSGSSGLINSTQNLASKIQSATLTTEMTKDAQNAASELISDAASEATFQTGSTGAGTSTQAQNAASQLQSVSSGLMSSANGATFKTENIDTGISTQAGNAVSHLHSVSSGIMNLGNGVASKTGRTGAGISTQAENAASQLQSVSSGIMNSANGVASRTGSAGAGVFTQAQNAASQLQSVSTGMMNSANGVASETGSAGAGVSTQAENAASQLQSVSTGMMNSANGVASETGSAGAGVSTQAENAASQLQSVPSGIMNSANGVASRTGSAGAGVFTQAQNAASQLQSVSTGMMNSANGVASETGSAGAGVSTQAENAASQLQSVSSGIVKSANGVASETGSAGAGVSTQAQNAASQLQSVSTGMMNSANGVASKTGRAGAGVFTQAQNAASQLQSVSSGIMNSANGVASETGSAGAGVSTQVENAASQLQSVSSGIMNSANGVASKTGSAGAGVSTQAENAAPQLQSVSSGIMNSANGVASDTGSAGAGLSTQALHAASQLNSMSSQTMNSANGVASMTGNAGAGVSKQAQNAASQFNSMSSGIMNAANGIESTANSATTSLKMSHIQSGATEKMSAAQQGNSQRFIGTQLTANQNKKHHRKTVFAENQRHETSDTDKRFAMLNQNKSAGIVKNANKMTAIINQGTAVTNSNQAVSSMTNVGSDTMSQLIRTTQNTGSNVFHGFPKPVISTAHSTTENVSNLLGGLGGAGTRFTGSVVMQTGSGSKTAFETSFRRGSASSSLMTTGSNGFTQVGSSLVGSIPLFRSFPDVYDQSSTVKTFSVNTHSKSSQTSTTERSVNNPGLSTIEDTSDTFKKSLFNTNLKKNQAELVDGQTSTTERNVDSQGLSTVEDKSITRKKSLFNTNTKNNQSELVDSLILTTERSMDNQALSPDTTFEDNNWTVSNNPKQSTKTKPGISDFYDEYSNNEEMSELELEEYTNRFADALRPVEFSRTRNK